MKNGSIAFLFKKYEAKVMKIASSSPPISVSVVGHELSVIPFVNDGSGLGSALVVDDGSGSACNSFASFDAQKVLRLATFYPKDFSKCSIDGT